MLKKILGTSIAVGKVGLSRIPSCSCALFPHTERVNYRAGQWKNANSPLPEIPLHVGHGCDINKETNMLGPMWSEGPTLPQSLADLVHDPVEQQDEENDSDFLYKNMWTSYDELEDFI